MKPDVPWERVPAFLSGDETSWGLMVPFFPSASPVEYRVPFLSELGRGKRVLVHGCMDDLEKMVRQIRGRRWLVSRISDTASRCVCITTSPASARAALEEIGDVNIICADIAEAPSPEIVSGQWDLLILADSLEHFDDPIGTLSSLREFYAGCIDSLVVTVPNAFSLDNRRYAMAGREFIHSDHRFWFTPYTLTKVLYRAGWMLDEIRMVEYSEPDLMAKIDLVRQARLRRHPLLRTTIVARCRPLDAPSMGTSA